MFLGLDKSNIIQQHSPNVEDIDSNLEIVEIADQDFEGKNPLDYKVFDNGEMITPKWEY